MKIKAGLFLCLSVLTSFAAEKPFEGVFANDKLTAKFTATDTGYAGEFLLDGQNFPLSAKELENKLTGKFKSEDTTFDFTAVIEKDVLTIKTDDTTYKLTRRGRSNPLAKKENALAAKKEETFMEPKNGPSGGPAWKVYKHPTGLSMSYPPDWQLKPFPQGLQLIPPDSGSNEKGPTEAYLVMAESAAGISVAEDPRVLAYIESQLLQIAPFFRRAGGVEKVRAGAAPGIFVTWEGTNPDGLKVQANALSTILKGYGISVIALGDAKLVKGREQTLRGIFASFAAGAGEKDPQVIGSWKFWSYSGSATGNYGTERSRFMVLQQDGAVLWKGRTESSATVKGKDSLGNETFVGGVAGQGSDNDRGTWSAGEGRLYVAWQNGGLSEWAYRVGGLPGNRRLHLQGADQSKPDEWVEAGP